MYRNRLPKPHDICVAEVKNITDMGAYCSLLEYNNMEGLLLLSELQRKRIRSVKRVISVGRMEWVVVTKVNEAQGYIDVSR